MQDWGRGAATMQLVAQDYAEILAALQAATNTKGHERRNAARMEVQAQITVQPFCDGKLEKAFTCLTRDLSFRGIGLLQGRQSASGTQFIVHLPRRSTDIPLKFICTVMYCRELADGLFNIGASFNGFYDPDAPSPGATPRSNADIELDRIRQSILD